MVGSAIDVKLSLPALGNASGGIRGYFLSSGTCPLPPTVIVFHLPNSPHKEHHALSSWGPLDVKGGGGGGKGEDD